MGFPVSGYWLERGRSLDRALLVKYMERTYTELDPTQPHAYLAMTVQRHLDSNTPLWWVKTQEDDHARPVACLWLGNALDPSTGERHAHILLIYVEPPHRRRGIATALLHQAQTWAKERGDGRISLQVFCQNQVALKLYEKMGFVPQSVLMNKRL